MRTKAGIIGVGLLGVALSAHAYTSPYSSMAVPGEHNGWSTTPSMVLAADNVWVGTQTLSTASGAFKFAANDGWSLSWGGGASLARVPAVADAPVPGGGNLGYSGFSNGLYRFTFNDATLEFRLEWAGGSPLPVPPFTSVALVGDFNAWTPSGSSLLTNHPGNTNLWSTSIALESQISFNLRVNGAQDWGAAVQSDLVPPVTDASACGSADFILTQFDPGTFYILFDSTNAAVSITQTSTSDVIVAMAVLGSFIGTNNPPPNMVLQNGTRWESTHDITNSGSVTVRFNGNYGARTWGATNASPIALPASGTLATGLTAYATISGMSNGRYRVSFDHVTGNFSFTRVYTLASGRNLIQNPGFESTSNGDASTWNEYQAVTKTSADGIPPHTGQQCGAIRAKEFPEMTDYSSYDQDVNVVTGKLYRASAWVRVTPDWTADIMQIKMEWRNATNAPVGDNSIVTISPDTTWRYFSIDGEPPEGATKAHVVLLCSGTGNSGYMCIDDVEVAQVPPREQDFDSWSSYASFGTISAPDGWSATSGKTTYNVPPGRPAAQVFISQYVEGTGNNKAVEIYNGTLSDLNLAAGNYVLQQYHNGSLTASVSIALSGTLSPGTCLVVARPDLPPEYAPDAAIGEAPTLQTNKYLTFNGDDVLVLRQGTNVIDRVGQVGTNAVGAVWNLMAKNRTLTRKSTIFTGTTSAVTAAFPSDDWLASESDTFDSLGNHSISFIDPNEPYTPAGYSLILNTNATLMSGEFAGGIGDISFWYRTESPTPVIDLSIESSISEDGPWTTNEILADVVATNFQYIAFSINSPNDRFVRFRHVNGGTNRFRLDEVVVSPYSSNPRLETFAAWTLPTYVFPGTYSRLGWTIQNATISTNTGSRAALLSPPDSAVLSPAYADGVGEVSFWTATVGSNETAYLLLQSRTSANTNWTTQAAFTVTTATNFTTWLYLTNNTSQIQIIFDPAMNSADVLVDDVSVSLPALYRNQNFNTWPAKSSYTTGQSNHQGWVVSQCIVESQEAYDGNAASLSTSYADAWIQSPYLPDGIGSIEFQLKKRTTNVNPVITVEVSANKLSWTPIATVTSTVASSYTRHAFFYSDTNNHFVRFRHSAGNTITPVDNIRIASPQPRPEVGMYPVLDPEAPTIGQSPYLTADVVTRYGASIVSVTGYYRINNAGWVPVAMSSVAFGSYVAVSPIPAQNAGTMLRYYVQVQYAGIGAAPSSTAFSTNLTNSITYTNYVSSIPKDYVWINEISYYYTSWDPLVGFDVFQDHEFIELCGVAGTTISNWTVQLGFGSSADIANYGGTNIYASYAITNTFANTTNGFGFYVLGDSGLLKANGSPIDRVFTTLVPASVNPSAAYMRDHMRDSRGIIRLLDEYKRPVYSIVYNGTAAPSLPSGSQTFQSSNSVSLRNTGSTYADFTWGNSLISIGAINSNQTLVAVITNGLAAVFHIPSKFVDSAVINTNMRSPVQAAHSDLLQLRYGFAAAAGYGQPAGNIYYRDDDGAWSTASMAFVEGSQDSGSDVYTEGGVAAYTNARGSTLEYVIETLISKPGIGPTFIGAGVTNEYALFDTLDAAKASPFVYTFAVPSIYATAYYKSGPNWIVVTDGNDPNDPYTTFKVYSATNLFIPLDQWKTNSFTTTTDYLDQITFTIPLNATNRMDYYRFDPTW